MNTLKVIQVLKVELKKNKVTYQEVAQQLRITEGGVKKLLNKGDISLKKVEMICDLLNISFLEVLKNAENENVESVRFNQQQVNFFLAFPHFFHFFMKLAYEQKTPGQIQTEFKLSNRSLSNYLKKLEELNLIKRHPRDQTQILGGIPLALNTRGTELDQYKYEIALQLLKQIKPLEKDQIRGAGFYLSVEQKNLFIEKLESLVLDFSAFSRSNRKKADDQRFQNMTFMSYIVDRSMFDQIKDIV